MILHAAGSKHNSICGSGDTCRLLFYLNFTLHHFLFAGFSYSAQTKGVFWLRSDKGRYTFAFKDAAGACKEIGASLATLEQLTAAYKAGMNECNCGWTTDGKAHYPICEKKDLKWACGGSVPGVRTCLWQNTWGIYCFRA